MTNVKNQEATNTNKRGRKTSQSVTEPKTIDIVEVMSNAENRIQNLLELHGIKSEYLTNKVFANEKALDNISFLLLLFEQQRDKEAKKEQEELLNLPNTDETKQKIEMNIALLKEIQSNIDFLSNVSLDVVSKRRIHLMYNNIHSKKSQPQKPLKVSEYYTKADKKDCETLISKIAATIHSYNISKLKGDTEPKLDYVKGKNMIQLYFDLLVGIPKIGEEGYIHFINVKQSDFVALSVVIGELEEDDKGLDLTTQSINKIIGKLDKILCNAMKGKQVTAGDLPEKMQFLLTGNRTNRPLNWMERIAKVNSIKELKGDMEAIAKLSQLLEVLKTEETPEEKANEIFNDIMETFKIEQEA